MSDKNMHTVHHYERCTAEHCADKDSMGIVLYVDGNDGVVDERIRLKHVAEVYAGANGARIEWEGSK
jgi:hypothetical protein